MGRKLLKKLWKDTKEVLSVSRGAIKTEIKGSGKFFSKKLSKHTGFKKIKRRRKSMKRLKSEWTGIKLNTKALYG